MDARPSKPLKPIKVVFSGGTQTLEVSLDAGQTGCVALLGVTLEESSPKVASGTSEPAARATEARAERTSDAESSASAQYAGTAPPADSLGPTKQPDTPDQEVSSAMPTDVTVQADAQGEAGTAKERPSFRIGPKAGGVVPRGELKSTFMLGIAADFSLWTIPSPNVAVFAHAELGWSPMRQQDTVLMAGRGKGDLIQETTVIPMLFGFKGELDLGAPVIPYATLGLAVDITRTRLRAFSLPQWEENDVALGIAGGLGVSLPISGGLLTAQLHYREARSDFSSNAISASAEKNLSGGAIHVGYLFLLP